MNDELIYETGIRRVKHGASVRITAVIYLHCPAIEIHANSFTPGRWGYGLESVISKLIWRLDILRISSEIDLR